MMFSGSSDVQHPTPVREGTKSTSYNKRRSRPVSAQSFSPFDGKFSVSYNELEPKGYSTASAQAFRLAAEKCKKLESKQEPRPSARSEYLETPGLFTSLLKIRKFKTTLHTLMEDFTLPERLDFTNEPNVSDISPIGFLAFNANNKPVREYKEALIRLQTDVDHVESFGKPEIRASRKQIIDVIEEALKKLESAINERLQQWTNTDCCERLVSEAHALNLKQTEFGCVLHPLDALPVLPLPNLDVCRRIGKDPKFRSRYTQMVSKLMKVQFERLDRIVVDQPTDDLDQSLIDLTAEWQRYLDDSTQTFAA